MVHVIIRRGTLSYAIMHSELKECEELFENNNSIIKIACKVKRNRVDWFPRILLLDRMFDIEISGGSVIFTYYNYLLILKKRKNDIFMLKFKQSNLSECIATFPQLSEYSVNENKPVGDYI